MQVLTSQSISHAKNFADFFSSQSIPHGFFVIKKAPKNLRPSMEKLSELYEYILDKANCVNFVFDCVKSSDQMQFKQLGFPITHYGAGINSISIEPDGNAYPCVKMHDNKERFICNFLKDDALSILSTYKSNLLKKDLVDNLNKCKDCKIKYICGGGCRADEDFITENKIEYSQCHLQYTNLNYFLEKVNYE